MDNELIVKYFSLVFNLLLVFSGIYIVGLGIAMEIKASAVTEICESCNVSVVPIVTIIVGSLVFLLALIGFFGAIRENHRMLISCGIFMIVLMVLKIAVAVFILNNIDDFVRNISHYVGRAFPGPGFHIIERTFSCCGVFGPDSYRRASVLLPDSCSCATGPCTDEFTFYGCATIVRESVTALTANTGITAITVAAVEFVAIASSLCYANIVRNKGRHSFINLIKL